MSCECQKGWDMSKRVSARFGVIVQADALLPRSVVLVRLRRRAHGQRHFDQSSWSKGVTTRVLVEQVGAVDVTRFGRSCRARQC